MFYIYIIYSQSSDIFYVGHSSEPWIRLDQHNTNTSDKFTGKHKDWKLRCVFEVSTNKGDADRLEKFIKRQKSRKLLERLIDPDYVPVGVLAQLVRVPDVRD